MTHLDLYADLMTRKLISRDGGAVTLSPFVLGDQLRCSLRTYERSESGDLRERDLRLRTLRASIGKVLATPTTGWFKLWIGDTDTPEINFDAVADVFKTAAQGILALGPMRFAFDLNLPDERGDGLDGIRHGKKADRVQAGVCESRMDALTHDRQVAQTRTNQRARRRSRISKTTYPLRSTDRREIA